MRREHSDADRTGKFVLLIYSLKASHQTVRSSLLFYWSSFDLRLALRRSWSARLKSLPFYVVKDIRRFRVLINVFLVKKKRDKTVLSGVAKLRSVVGSAPVSEALSGCPQIVRQQGLLTLWAAPARILEYVHDNNAAHSQRDTQNTDYIFIYQCFCSLIITDTRPCRDLTALFLTYSSIHKIARFMWHLHCNSLSWLDSGIHSASRKS